VKLTRNTAIVFLLLLLIVKQDAYAQKRVNDTIINSNFYFGFSYAFQTPSGDLYERFGNNSAAGVSFGYKSRKNYFFQGSWSYLFGTEIKEDGILDSITTADGFLIDKEGKTADIRIFERGFTAHASVGKIFKTRLFSPNPNSGIIVMTGIGILQHKIRIIDNGGRSPQLSGDYLKGYDRLTNGVSTNEFIGYWFMSRSRYVNFFAGFDLTQGFTQSRRSWDYDLMRADTEKRLDLLWGVRVGWVIPFGKKGSSNVFIY
jgi:hypothetical protein